MEDLIITSLTKQIFANHAAIAKLDQAIQVMETSMNDFQGRLRTLESTVKSHSKRGKEARVHWKAAPGGARPSLTLGRPQCPLHV